MVVAARKPDGIDFVKNSKISSFCVNPPPTARYRTYGLIIPHSAAVGMQFSGAESIASEHLECAEEDPDIAAARSRSASARRAPCRSARCLRRRSRMRWIFTCAASKSSKFHSALANRGNCWRGRNDSGHWGGPRVTGLRHFGNTRQNSRPGYHWINFVHLLFILLI